MLYQDLTEKIIGTFYRVMDGLGPGLPEKLYQLALQKCISKTGLLNKSEVKLPVCF